MVMAVYIIIIIFNYCIFLLHDGCAGDIKMSSKHGIVVDDEDMDINVDDDEVEDYKTSPIAATKSSGGQLNIGKFSFSITNILSDTFGAKTVKTEQPDLSQNDMKLFRPFEIKNFIANNAANRNASFLHHHQNFNPSSVFLNSFRLSDIFNDYSTKAENNIKSSDNSIRNNIYNTFSSYPKIHEEILNHKAAKLSNRPPQSSIASHSSTKFTSALGGLCKTISQIGQENCLSPPLQQSSSLSSTTTTATTISSSISSNKSCTSEKSAESMVDSDDCQSEASGYTKDDNGKMWPAWIFCTRYSDRPSSGEFQHLNLKKKKHFQTQLVFIYSRLIKSVKYWKLIPYT